MFTKFMGSFGEELATFSHGCFPIEISAYFENFQNGQPTKVKHFHCPTNHYREGCCKYCPGE
jgi:hypothetical protein